jgi:sulfur transfer protein SufE
MIRTITAIYVLNVHASAGDAHATELTDTQDFVDRFIANAADKLVDRLKSPMSSLGNTSHKTLPLRADLDRTMLGKPGHVLAPQMAAPLTSLSFRGPQPSVARSHVTLHRARRRDLHTTRAASAGGPPLPAELQKIVGAFQMVPDPMQRYKQLLFFAGKLPPMSTELKTQESKVMGCTSQVWVVPRLEDDLVYFSADSDSQLTKGLAALLVQGLSGSSPKEILTVEPDFIEQLGLKQSLTPSRNNGFLNMLNHMKQSTLDLYVASEKAESAGD